MAEPIQVAEEKMKKAIETLKEEFATIRAGRANPHILDKVMVDYYGVPTPIPQVASITVPEARMIVIQPWEARMLKEIEKAIQKSDLGVNPTNDGKVIRLIFPELTEERRKELVKQVKKMAEDAKVAIRNIRREALDEYKKMKKNNEITEDDLKDAEEDVQKLHDKYIEQIEKLLSAKEKEIMEV
ncbi:ribosome recycling factor [Caldicellulosiruptor bescii]|uniref:Ribosome-recycling factor n=4 Tax=Caldicellulosiruptor TaxID=44000 RepID=RRF_CALBD|nr:MULTISPECIES: ribosome recycling factor [Caldicellulosiruptor]B9MKP8.1 RecName: Full=Ribosome-recycling factor; Short=RRF; AltName: Full=Ribosome-releasing factor [Caldicellulosiruptor bescii DSM 6725]ACM60906.1 ribosome recycling factor [Caldicellulosiruptor bescii DSM 6725]ADQ06662.1 ribosome recycling factor [Caldicellulosiruptor hydrothermalis 108]ADQ45772.1 ribosome recycling factor [Caldicellulosiruptor kronotskyensis 2002]PBC89276.1 ribosome recycling factor [Caldicellulosiruptor bes